MLNLMDPILSWHGLRPVWRNMAAAVLAGSCLVPSSRANFIDWLLPKHDVQVITVTDTTPVGALLRPASPEHPVYYVAVSLGYRDLGGLIAGDKIPPKEVMTKTIAKVLAKQGYIPATTAHPPTLLLVWTWGTLYADRFYDPSDALSDGRQTNRAQMLRFLGAYKLGLISKEPDPFARDNYTAGLMIHTPDADAIYDVAQDDLFMAAIAAYDYRAATQKKKELLWMTKISCPATGLLMDQTLPTMMVIAGPNIGRDTPHPVWVNASDKFKPNVQIGDPKLVEFLDQAKLPIIDASQVAKTKSKAPTQK